MIEEIKNIISVSRGQKSHMEMIRKGNVCIGLARYKGKEVCLWLGKIPELELTGKNHGDKDKISKIERMGC
jgi:hypothetical protein